MGLFLQFWIYFGWDIAIMSKKAKRDKKMAKIAKKGFLEN